MRREAVVMSYRVLLAVGSCIALIAAAWFSTADPKADGVTSWVMLEKGIFRTKSTPHTYALVAGEKALLIDASSSPETVAELGSKSIEAVLLTHHHRDTAEFSADFRKKGVSVRAPKASADWLTRCCC